MNIQKLYENLRKENKSLLESLDNDIAAIDDGDYIFDEATGNILVPSDIFDYEKGQIKEICFIEEDNDIVYEYKMIDVTDDGEYIIMEYIGDSDSSISEAANPKHEKENGVLRGLVDGSNKRYSTARKDLKKMGYDIEVDSSARKDFGRDYFGDHVTIRNPDTGREIVAAVNSTRDGNNFIRAGEHQLKSKYDTNADASEFDYKGYLDKPIPKRSTEKTTVQQFKDDKQFLRDNEDKAKRIDAARARMQGVRDKLASKKTDVDVEESLKEDCIDPECKIITSGVPKRYTDVMSNILQELKNKGYWINDKNVKLASLADKLLYGEYYGVDEFVDDIINNNPDYVINYSEKEALKNESLQEKYDDPKAMGKGYACPILKDANWKRDIKAYKEILDDDEANEKSKNAARKELKRIYREINNNIEEFFEFDDYWKQHYKEVNKIVRDYTLSIPANIRNDTSIKESLNEAYDDADMMETKIHIDINNWNNQIEEDKIDDAELKKYGIELETYSQGVGPRGVTSHKHFDFTGYYDDIYKYFSEKGWQKAIDALEYRREKGFYKSSGILPDIYDGDDNKEKGFIGKPGMYLTKFRDEIWVSKRVGDTTYKISDENYNWIKDNFELELAQPKDFGQLESYLIKKKSANESIKEDSDRKIFKCDVYNNIKKFHDTYVVIASTEEEAFDNCYERLADETDDPENYEVLDVYAE